MIRSLLRPWRFGIVLIAALLLVAEALNAAPALITQKIVDEHLTTGVREGLFFVPAMLAGMAIFHGLAARPQADETGASAAAPR